jgi:hypothetical protein
MNTTTSRNNATEDRVLALLGKGIPPETVAGACGISVSRISQLLSDPEFTAQVADLRFAALEKHNITDSKYDAMEDTLLDKLKDCLPLIAMDPLKLLRAVSVINAAKRRGLSAPEQIHAQNTVVQLIMPNIIVQKFTTNINNQVIHAGDQTLETIPSHMLAQEFTQAPVLNTISKESLISALNTPVVTPNVIHPVIPSSKSEEVQYAMQQLTANSSFELGS